MTTPTHPAFDLDWNLVRTFAAVAQAGSLASGAHTMGITHPTAARHIAQLEDQLGMALFTRTGKGLKLNEAGLQLQDSAKAMHSQALAFASRSDSLRARPIETVRISVAEMFAELMPEVLFADLNPIDCGIVEMHVANQLVNLLQRDADLAIRHVRPEQQELLCRKVGSLQMGLFANQDYVNAYGLVSADTVHSHKFVDGLTRDHLVRGAARQGVTIAPEQVAFRSDSLGAQRAAVRAGVGAGAFPVWMSFEEPAWVPVWQGGEPIELQVWLVARPEVRDNEQLKCMFSKLGDALVQRLTPYATR